MAAAGQPVKAGGYLQGQDADHMKCWHVPTIGIGNHFELLGLQNDVNFRPLVPLLRVRLNEELNERDARLSFRCAA